jgi:hypothetical protein
MSQRPNERANMGMALGPVPPLEAVIREPGLVERLPQLVAIAYRRAIKRLDADLEAHIAARVDLPEAGRAPDQDRAIGLAEASKLLDIKRRTLERPPKWRQLGGYRDIDGHIKFRLLDLRRYLARRSTRLG